MFVQGVDWSCNSEVINMGWLKLLAKVNLIYIYVKKRLHFFFDRHAATSSLNFLGDERTVGHVGTDDSGIQYQIQNVVLYLHQGADVTP